MIADAGGRASFYLTSEYAADAGVSWKSAAELGMEAGLHTESHPHGGELSTKAWQDEMTQNISALVSLGIRKQSVVGFRAPYLEYNDAMLAEIRNQMLWYDCSIEEGFGHEEDGKNHYFPYTLDHQSPGHIASRTLGVPTRQFALTSHPGLFELPVYALIVHNLPQIHPKPATFY
jgi:peptidoglycan/xylan/chitin deacetylase (PgdA/CDA1 family)